MKNKLIGFIIGVAFAISVSAYAQWTKSDLRELIKNVVESHCEVEDDGNIGC